MFMVRGKRLSWLGCAGLIIASILLLNAAPAVVHAADFDLTVSPLPIDLSVKPGGTVSTPLRVQNTGSSPVQINVSLKKFGAKNNTGSPEILDPGPGDDFINWVSFSETSFQAEPNVWHTITMTIKPPAYAGFGYYYAVVFSEANSTKQLVSPNLHARVNGAVASLVLLDVNAPGEKRQLTAAKFTSAKKVYEYLPSTFTVMVHNTGNVHALPAGDIFISKDHKNNVATLELNGAGGNILPNTSRLFPVSWQDGSPVFEVKKVNGQVVSDSKGNPVETLSWDGFSPGKIRFGRYYAHLLLTYNDGTRDVPVEGEVAFWVIPWKLLLILLVIIALLATGPFFMIRNLLTRRHPKPDRR